jgi:hypothetical protein
MYENSNIDARSYNHCCSGKAISVTYCGCVSVAYGFQHAMCMCHIVICGISVSMVFLFSHFLINGMIFEKKSTEQKMCLNVF